MDSPRYLRGNQALLYEIADLARVRYRSIPNIIRDLALWLTATWISELVNNPFLTVIAVGFIGAIPMHDLMVHGHEGVHGLICRKRSINEFFNWFNHALVGISGTAYRAFHLTHHRLAHTDQDPELSVLSLFGRNPPGWLYLFVPILGYFGFNFWALRFDTKYANRKTIAIDLILAATMHLAILVLIGARAYLIYVICPIITSLAATNAFRSICEHHGLPRGSSWLNTRAMKTHPLLECLWSNVNYHLEHHLFSFVPFHMLPKLRRILKDEYKERGSTLDSGYLSTSLRLLCTAEHIATTKRCLVDPNTFSFRLKVAWFKDILKNSECRRYLWSLYYAGEAYVELHPNGVFIAHLASPLCRLLDRHLADETRHAEIFRQLLLQEGAQPEKLSEIEDLGWYSLNKMVPDIVRKGQSGLPFTSEESARYMSFLHTLELRSISDLYALLTAARELKMYELCSNIETIIPDEVFHAVYTHRAVVQLVGASNARALFDSMRRKEVFHYTDFCLAILRRFVSLKAIPQKREDYLRWKVMELACLFHCAFPFLPIFENPPHSIAPNENLKRYVEKKTPVSLAS